MDLTKDTLDWIERTTAILNSHVIRLSNYVALEGLPCAGKTSTIRGLKLMSECYVIDELRLPPKEESCLSYLLQEPTRAKHIHDISSKIKKVVGDRCIISTLAHKATLLTYEGHVDYNKEIRKIKDLANNSQIVLPSKIISLDISIDISRQRQKLRDRNILEGRLWYNSQFLTIMKKVTNNILILLYSNNEHLHHIDSENNDLNKVLIYVKNELEGKNETRNFV